MRYLRTVVGLRSVPKDILGRGRHYEVVELKDGPFLVGELIGDPPVGLSLVQREGVDLFHHGSYEPARDGVVVEAVEMSEVVPYELVDYVEEVVERSLIVEVYCAGRVEQEERTEVAFLRPAASILLAYLLQLLLGELWILAEFVHKHK